MKFKSHLYEHNEKLIWEIEVLLRDEDSKLNQALILQKIFYLKPQRHLTDSIEGVIYLIEEKNIYWGEKIRIKLTQTTKEVAPYCLSASQFSIFLVLLLQITILCKLHNLKELQRSYGDIYSQLLPLTR